GPEARHRSAEGTIPTVATAAQLRTFLDAKKPDGLRRPAGVALADGGGSLPRVLFSIPWGVSCRSLSGLACLLGGRGGGVVGRLQAVAGQVAELLGGLLRDAQDFLAGRVGGFGAVTREIDTLRPQRGDVLDFTGFHRIGDECQVRLGLRLQRLDLQALDFGDALQRSELRLVGLLGELLAEVERLLLVLAVHGVRPIWQEW